MRPTASSVRWARAAGIVYVTGSVGFLAVFSWLAAAFGYPDVLDRSAAEVLPALLSLGGTGRLVWAVYAILPLLLIQASVGASEWLRDWDGRVPGAARLGLALQAVAAVAMTLGLARWSTANWILVESWGIADSAQRVVLAAVFDAVNSFFGNAIGEFVGELALYSGFVAFAGMLRNVTPVVQPAADIANLLLPLFLIVFGVVLVRLRLGAPSEAVP